MLIDFTPSLLTGLMFSAILVMRSIFAFTRTGPELRDEVMRTYRGYTIATLAKLAMASLIVLTWLAAGGQHVLYSVTMAAGWGRPTLIEYAAAGLGIASVVGGQFLVHLHRIPSSLLISSNYKMSRFLWLWDHLTASRIALLNVALMGVPILAATVATPRILSAESPGQLLQYWGLLALILAPKALLQWLERRAPISPRNKAKPSAGVQRPNIIMLGSDTLRSDHLSFFGCDRGLTPNIDRLASSGFAFPNCYTPIARTAPSLISLFSGCWPHEHGIRYNYVADADVELSVPLLPRILRDNGYRTAAITDWAGSDLNKFDLGFDQVDGPADQWNLKTLIRQGPKDLRLFLSLFTHNALGKLLLPDMYYLAGIPLTSNLTRDTCVRLNQFVGSEQPFFLNLFMATTHPPFGSEYPYYCKYSDPAYRGESKFGMARLVDPFDIIRSQKEPKEAFDLAQIQALYDGCVRRFDDAVGEIVEHLKQVGLTDDTIVVIYSDHGMELFEHGTWGQGNSAFGDASPRVPLVIKDSRASGPGLVSKPIRTLDIAPTLLELCNLPADPRMSGWSALDESEDSGKDERVIYFETGIWLTKPPGQEPEHIDYPDLLDLLTVENTATGTLSIKAEFRDVTILARDRMVLTRRWKLVRLPYRHEIRYLLFDLHDDPECRHDVAAAQAEVVVELKRLLRPYLDADSSPEPGV